MNLPRNFHNEARLNGSKLPYSDSSTPFSSKTYRALREIRTASEPGSRDARQLGTVLLTEFITSWHLLVPAAISGSSFCRRASACAAEGIVENRPGKLIQIFEYGRHARLTRSRMGLTSIPRNITTPISGRELLNTHVVSNTIINCNHFYLDLKLVYPDMPIRALCTLLGSLGMSPYFALTSDAYSFEITLSRERFLTWALGSPGLRTDTKKGDSFAQ